MEIDFVDRSITNEVIHKITVYKNAWIELVNDCQPRWYELMGNYYDKYKSYEKILELIMVHNRKQMKVNYPTSHKSSE
jgi:hypothetical protein